MERLQVLIADDHVIFRDGLRILLLGAPELDVVGEATTGEEAVAQAATLQPDLVVMDLQMPGMGGIAATRHIVGASPHVRVLVVTMFEDDHTVFAAMRAGARGYLLKGAGHDEMLRAIRAVAHGEAIFSPGIADRMMRYFTAAPAEVPRTVLPELSDREREVLALIAQGVNNQGLAERLVLSPKTVRNHITNILSKLQVTDRAQAIVRARNAGLG
jgi:DNA-binding NarL/FixJ family response regulator